MSIFVKSNNKYLEYDFENSNIIEHFLPLFREPEKEEIEQIPNIIAVKDITFDPIYIIASIGKEDILWKLILTQYDKHKYDNVNVNILDGVSLTCINLLDDNKTDYVFDFMRNIFLYRGFVAENKQCGSCIALAVLCHFMEERKEKHFISLLRYLSKSMLSVSIMDDRNIISYLRKLLILDKVYDVYYIVSSLIMFSIYEEFTRVNPVFISPFILRELKILNFIDMMPIPIHAESIFVNEKFVPRKCDASINVIKRLCLLTGGGISPDLIQNYNLIVFGSLISNILLGTDSKTKYHVGIVCDSMPEHIGNKIKASMEMSYDNVRVRENPSSIIIDCDSMRITILQKLINYKKYICELPLCEDKIYIHDNTIKLTPSCLYFCLTGINVKMPNFFDIGYGDIGMSGVFNAKEKECSNSSLKRLSELVSPRRCFCVYNL